MVAEILCVGTELLMGQVLNTNAQFLSRRLSALGISQYHQDVVGDNAQRLEEAYRLALSRADVVITSGGLGPTVDDITKRVAAKVAGKELVVFPEAEEMVRTRFRQYHKDMTANNMSQAMFTPDSTILLNPNGTAPGAIVPVGEGKVIIHLPGPPFELEPMFVDQVEPYLQARSGHVLVSKYIRIFGMGESDVDQRLHDLEEQENPTLSPYCSLGEVQLRATARAKDKESAEKLLLPLARCGVRVVGMDDVPLRELIGRLPQELAAMMDRMEAGAGAEAARLDHRHGREPDGRSDRVLHGGGSRGFAGGEGRLCDLSERVEDHAAGRTGGDDRAIRRGKRGGCASHGEGRTGASGCGHCGERHGACWPGRRHAGAARGHGVPRHCHGEGRI